MQPTEKWREGTWWLRRSHWSETRSRYSNVQKFRHNALKLYHPFKLLPFWTISSLFLSLIVAWGLNLSSFLVFLYLSQNFHPEEVALRRLLRTMDATWVIVSWTIPRAIRMNGYWLNLVWQFLMKFMNALQNKNFLIDFPELKNFFEFLRPFI